MSWLTVLVLFISALLPCPRLYFTLIHPILVKKNSVSEKNMYLVCFGKHLLIFVYYVVGPHYPDLLLALHSGISPGGAQGC